MVQYASITVDLDPLHHYRAIHGLPATSYGDADVTYTLGVSRLLTLFNACSIPATLFVIGGDVAQQEHRDLLVSAYNAGHELGNHTHAHRYNLRAHARDVIVQDISAGEDAIASITGTAPRGFRTPGYNVDDTILDILAERGYLYDSSVFNTTPYYMAKGAVMAWRKLCGAPSRSHMILPKNLLATSRHYIPKRGAFWRHDANSDLPTEVPMCTIPILGVPVIGTSLHLLGASGFARIFPMLRRHHPDLFHLEFHSIDFIDAHDPGVDEELIARQPDLRVPWAIKRARYTQIFSTIAEHCTFKTLEDAVVSIRA